MRRFPGLVTIEHEFQVPLKHSEPGGKRITVFAREVCAPDGQEKPFLVFLQGGPGFEAARPTAYPSSPGWLERALRDFRVLMLDQRGTGRSTPVGRLEGMTSEEQADYLSCFRADSIVQDAEMIRKSLGLEKWSLLGQSFGGFCAVHYMSSAPEALREVLLCGGIPPIGGHPDQVYEATYARTRERCGRYYDRYPDDLSRVIDIHERLAANNVTLPNGDRLTSNMFRQLGHMLGMSDGAERLHYIVELDHTSRLFLHDVQHGLPEFSRNPLYSVIHEACYADGTVTDWSGLRVMPEDFKASSELFTGEHVYPWMFEDYGELRSLAGAAELLARHQWPPLYDDEVLRSCNVPAAAVIYANDMYVERALSEETASKIPSMRTWLTNEYEHNGLRADGEKVLGRLIAMARDT